jgi:hypothetical protein
MKRAFALLAPLSLAGCYFLDSPTQLTQATPIQMAASGRSVIFESPTESNNCVLLGGAVSFTSNPKPGDGADALQFTYRLSTSVPRNDVVCLSNEAGVLSISGRGTYGLTRPGTDQVTLPIRGMGISPRELVDRDGARLSIASLGRNHYLVRAKDAAGRRLFGGTLIPKAGIVYVRDALFTPVVPSYAGDSQHNCGNWNDPSDAAAALGRVERLIPR